MKKLLSKFSALIILTVFSYTSCFNPFFNASEEKFDPFNPGEGTPKYAFIDENGNISEEDTGRTVFTIDDNIYTKDMLLRSEDVDDSKRVMLSYKNYTITMFFENDIAFPTSMVMADSSEKYYGYFSPYNEETQTFNLIVEQDNNYDFMSNIFLDKEILVSYENDLEKTPSQNDRIHNLKVALSVYAGLYSAVDSSARGLFSSIFKGLLKVAAFVASAIIFCTVSPILGVALLIGFDYLFSESEQPKTNDKIMIGVTWPSDPNKIDNPEELLHFLKGIPEYIIRIEVYGGTWNESKLNKLINSDVALYCPEVEYKEKENENIPMLGYFKRHSEKQPYEITKDTSSSKVFYIKFVRYFPYGTHENCELRLGLKFDSILVVNQKNVDIKFYGEIDGYSGKKDHPLKHEDHHTLLLMRFCLDDHCNHIVR